MNLRGDLVWRTAVLSKLWERTKAKLSDWFGLISGVFVRIDEWNRDDG